MAILGALFHPSQAAMERPEEKITQSCYLDVFWGLSHVREMRSDTAVGA